MAPKAGRIYSARATVVVGNGKGIYGVATAQEPLATSAIISARRQAFKNLQCKVGHSVLDKLRLISNPFTRRQDDIKRSLLQFP